MLIAFLFIFGSYAIDQILSAESREVIVENIHSHLIELGEKVAADKVPLAMYEIHKVRAHFSIWNHKTINILFSIYNSLMPAKQIC